MAGKRRLDSSYGIWAFVAVVVGTAIVGAWMKTHSPNAGRNRWRLDPPTQNLVIRQVDSGPAVDSLLKQPEFTDNPTLVSVNHADPWIRVAVRSTDGSRIMHQRVRFSVRDERGRPWTVDQIWKMDDAYLVISNSYADVPKQLTLNVFEGNMMVSYLPIQADVSHVPPLLTNWKPNAWDGLAGYVTRGANGLVAITVHSAIKKGDHLEATLLGSSVGAYRSENGRPATTIGKAGELRISVRIPAIPGGETARSVFVKVSEADKGRHPLRTSIVRVPVSWPIPGTVAKSPKTGQSTS